MQKKIIQVSSLIILFALSCLQTTAQTISENTQGETIVLFPDGSWRYYDENDPEDQSLMQRYLRSLSQTPNNQAAGDFAQLGADTATEEWNFESESKLNEEQSRQVAIRSAESALAREAHAVKHEIDATEKRKRVQEQIENLKRKGSSSEMIGFLKNKLKELEIKERSAKKRRDEASKEARLYERMVYMSEKKRKKLLAKMEEEKSKPQEFSIVNDVETAIKENPAAPARSNTANEKPRAAFAAFPPERLVINTPPAPDCTIAFDGTDKFSGKRRRDIAPQHFFSHTNDRLRAYFKNKDRIECEANVSAVSGGYKFLSISVYINDEKAQRNYGSIEKGSLLSVKLIDGTNVILTNNKTDLGIVDQVNQRVVYRAQYMIGPDQEKAFKKTEIDMVRIVWSSGYEDYEVFETDFMMNQFACLNRG